MYKFILLIKLLGLNLILLLFDVVNQLIYLEPENYGFHPKTALILFSTFRAAPSFNKKTYLRPT